VILKMKILRRDYGLLGSAVSMFRVEGMLVGSHVPYLTASLPRSPCLHHLAHIAAAGRMDLWEVGFNGEGWTEAIQDWARRPYFVTTTMNLLFP
jgi:hypothetical protein